MDRVAGAQPGTLSPPAPPPYTDLAHNLTALRLPFAHTGKSGKEETAQSACSRSTHARSTRTRSSTRTHSTYARSTYECSCSTCSFQAHVRSVFFPHRRCVEAKAQRHLTRHVPPRAHARAARVASRPRTLSTLRAASRIGTPTNACTRPLPHRTARARRMRPLLARFRTSRARAPLTRPAHPRPCPAPRAPHAACSPRLCPPRACPPSTCPPGPRRPVRARPVRAALCVPALHLPVPRAQVSRARPACAGLARPPRPRPRPAAARTQRLISLLSCNV